MSRHNNAGRSLAIIARQNGWDPSTCEGTPLPHYNENRVTEGDAGPNEFQGNPDLQGPPVTAQFPGQRTEHNQATRTTGADPFPSMPGAK
jgi:hypothetical protein